MSAANEDAYAQCMLLLTLTHVETSDQDEKGREQQNNET